MGLLRWVLSRASEAPQEGFDDVARGVCGVQLVQGAVGIPLAIDNLVARPCLVDIDHRGLEHMVDGVAGLELLQVQQAVHV